MARYIAKRLVYMVLVFFLLTFILFVLYQMMPANRAYTDARTEIQTMKRLSEEEKATKFEELYLKYQRIYGTDTDNKLVLYLRWLGLYPFYDTGRAVVDTLGSLFSRPVGREGCCK